MASPPVSAKAGGKKAKSSFLALVRVQDFLALLQRFRFEATKL